MTPAAKQPGTACIAVTTGCFTIWPEGQQHQVLLMTGSIILTAVLRIDVGIAWQSKGGSTETNLGITAISQVKDASGSDVVAAEFMKRGHILTDGI